MMAMFDDTMISMDIDSEDYDNYGNYKINYSNGYTLTIQYDEWAESPREWDNAGTMICAHRNYDLGDRMIDPNQYSSFEEILDEIKENEGDIVWRYLYLFDHSGISMSMSREQFHAADSQGWDWGTVGFIYISHKDILKEWGNGANEVTPELIEAAVACMESEVDTYDDFIRGNVYAYIIEDENGNVLDACGGFFGYEDVKSEAMHQAEWHWNHFLSKTPVQGVLFQGE